MPRILDLLDAHGIKMTSFMIGDAVRGHPEVAFDFPGFDPAAYQQQLTDEFDQLYAEGAHRRRMMVIGLHERLSGHASRVRVLDRVFTRLRYQEDVWWARKDQIARWTLDHPDMAARVDRSPAPVSGLPDGTPEARSGTCLVYPA